MAERASRALVLIAASLLAAAALVSQGASLWGGTEPAPLHVLVFDASASAVRGRVQGEGRALRQLLTEARRAEREGADAAVVRVARGAELIHPPAQASALVQRLLRPEGNSLFLAAVEEDSSTDLRQALALVHRLLEEEGRLGVVTVLGDGISTDGDLEGISGRLRESGHALLHVPPDAAPRPDLALLELRAPARVAPARSVGAQVRLQLRGPDPVPVRLSWSLRSDDWTEEGVLELGDLAPGAPRWITLETGIPTAGTWELSVTGRATGDGLHENDVQVARGTVAASRMVLVVAEPSPATQRLMAELQDRGLSPRLGTPASLADDLVESSALLTIDTPLRLLPAMAVRTFLTRGGTWLHAGAGSAWAAGGPEELASCLPLEPAPPDQGPRDVVLLVDGSGSMRGGPWVQVRKGVVQLAGGLGPSDGLILRTFTTRLGDPLLRVEPGAAEDLEAAVSALLERGIPGGATDVGEVLLEAAAARREAGRRSLCVLVSDGHSSHGNTPVAASQRAQLREAQADLAVVVIEPEGHVAARGALSRLLLEGEELVEGGDLTALGRALQELTREESTFVPAALLPAAPGAPAGRVSREPVLEGLLSDLREGPALAPRTAARVQLTEGGDPRSLLLGPEGDVLMAGRRVGVGLSLAAAFAPSGGVDEFPWAHWLDRLATELQPPALRIAAQGESLQLVPLEAGSLPPVNMEAVLRAPDQAGPLGRRRGGRELARWSLPPAPGDPRGPRRLEPPAPLPLEGGTRLAIEAAGVTLWEGPAPAWPLSELRAGRSTLEPGAPLGQGNGPGDPALARLLALLAALCLGAAALARPSRQASLKARVAGRR